jgi:hypothetical protein
MVMCAIPRYQYVVGTFVRISIQFGYYCIGVLLLYLSECIFPNWVFDGK